MKNPTKPTSEILLEVQRDAEQLLSKGDSQKAVDLLDRIGEDLSNYPNLYRLKGVARLIQGSNTEARLIFDEVEGSFGDDPTFLNLYGVALRRERDLNRAKTIYNRALELDPEQPALLSNFGNLLIDLGELVEAEKLLRKALKLVPDYADARQNLARLERAQGIGASETLKSEDGANVSLIIRDEQDTEAAADWLKLAATAQREGNYEESIVFARRSIEAQTDLAPAYKLAGEVMTGLKRYNEAEQALLYGVLLGEPDANTLSNLGGICASRGQYRLAKLLFNRVLSQHPEHEAAKRNLQLLEQTAANTGNISKSLF